MYKIEIPKRARFCTCCSAPFEPKCPYFSSISKGEEDYLREDYCEGCWKKTSADALLAFWRGRVPPKKQDPDLPKDKEERAMHLLKEALCQDNENQKILAFYLALYLQRQKMLTLRKELQEESGRRIYLFEVIETEEMLAVPRAAVTKGALTSVQKEIASLLTPSSV